MLSILNQTDKITKNACIQAFFVVFRPIACTYPNKCFHILVKTGTGSVFMAAVKTFMTHKYRKEHVI